MPHRASPDEPSPAGGSGPRRRLISVTGEEGRPVAVLAGGQSYERASLARMLVTAGFDVRATVAELQAGDDFRLAVVDLDRSDDAEPEVLRGLLAARPSVRVLARSSDARRASSAAAVQGLPDAQLEVVARQTSLAALVVRARELVGLSGPEPPAERVSCEQVSADGLARIPSLVIDKEDLEWFAAGADQAAVLRCIDGRTDLRAIATRCGLAPAAVAAITTTLVDQGLVRLE